MNEYARKQLKNIFHSTVLTDMMKNGVGLQNTD